MNADAAMITMRVRIRRYRSGLWLARAADFIVPGSGQPVIMWWLNHIVRLESKIEKQKVWQRVPFHADMMQL